VAFREAVFGDARLILGDCLEVIPIIGRVNHVITDPPYEDDAHRADRKITGRNRPLIAEPFNFASIEATRDAVAVSMRSVCDGWLIAFCMAEGVRAWRDSIETAGAKYKRSMVWIKPDAMPQFNGQGPAVGFEMMVSAWCGDGYSQWNGGGRVGTFYHNKNSGGKHEHPAQKPLPLIRELIELFSSPGEIILDPFMGSGTTGVACIQLGRQFIGVEQNEEYFDIACKRMAEAYSQPRLPLAIPKPKQTNFFDEAETPQPAGTDTD
jgi:site-specific DNA-methyltransferase (adenine-specific)